jgi:hypothetical protein
MTSNQAMQPSAARREAHIRPGNLEYLCPLSIEVQKLACN